MRKKKLTTMLTAIAMAMMLPVTSLAANHTAGTFEELKTAFADTDEKIYIVLTGDIEFTDGLETLTGREYTIDGNTYVLVDAYFYGSGDVTVNADVEAENSDALTVGGNTSVTVNGDVTNDNNGSGVVAEENSKVTVNGDVTGGDGYYDYDNYNYVYGYGVCASDNASVTVDGDVNGHDGTPDEYEGVMTDPEGYSDGRAGVYASGEASVNVTGDVTGGDAYGTYGYAGDGVEARDNASVTVGGDISGGNVIADPDVIHEEYSESEAGRAVIMDSTASVTAGGNVKGGDTNGDGGYAGAGVVIELELIEYEGDGTEIINPAGKLEVGGSIAGGNSESGTDASAVYYVGEDIPYYGTVTAEEFENDEEALEFLFEDSYSGIGEACAAADASTNKYMNRYNEELVGAFAEATGIPEDDIYDYDPNDLFVGLSPDKKAELMETMVGVYNDIIKEINPPEARDSIVAPEVTVFGLSAETGTSTVDGDIQKMLQDVLHSEFNYTVKVIEPENGTLTVEGDPAKAGETIIVNPKPNQGYKIAKVLLNGQELKAVNGVYSFVMPEDGLMEVSAVFEKETSEEVTTTVSATKGNTPKTGDNSHVLMMLALMILSGTVIVIAGRKKAR